MIDFDFSHGEGYSQVGTYWINDHYKGIARQFLNELLTAMKGPNYFNNDNAMIDYFHRSHYTDINIGKWNKPYKLDIENMGSSLLPKCLQRNCVMKLKVGDTVIGKFILQKLRKLSYVKMLVKNMVFLFQSMVG